MWSGAADAIVTVVPLSETSVLSMPVTLVPLAVGWKMTSRYWRLFVCPCRLLSVSTAVVSTNDHVWSRNCTITESHVVVEPVVVQRFVPVIAKRNFSGFVESTIGAWFGSSAIV